MTLRQEPLVSVLTPVYNGEDYLVECIESVLNQSYQNFEYTIVNNCSKDRTLQIALEYANKDSRIRVHDNLEFVEVIANHNIAFSLVPAEAKYCKVVSADDYLMPDCLAKMVEFAEANPSVAIVGSYQLSGDSVRWQGFRYPKSVFTGREICRQIFLGHDKTFGFGSPTSILYRADIVRSSKAFYPNPSPHSDTSACFENLHNSFFGFVYQVLSYERTHEATQSSKSVELERFISGYLNDLKYYGPLYLSKEEMIRQLDELLGIYHRFLAVDFFVGFRDKAFWDYHRSRLEELGYPLSRMTLLKAAFRAIFGDMKHPLQAIKKLRKRIRWRSTDLVVRTTEPIAIGSEATPEIAKGSQTTYVEQRLAISGGARSKRGSRDDAQF